MKLLPIFLQNGEKEYTHKRLGLDRIGAVLQLLGHPERSFPAVLIGGTNGKGSVARMVESVLLQGGHNVGLYTSPHLEHFEERIRVAGQNVEAALCESILQGFVNAGVLTANGSMITPSGESLTWFEKTTVLAFEAFRRAKVSLAILEVGLGARLDATNVSDPMVSAITSIDLDHTEVLGNSLFDIAREKSAVMRPGRPLILGHMDQPVRTFLMKAARMAGAHPVTPKFPQGTSEAFSYGPFSDLQLGLLGRHQLGNAAVAIEILVALKEAGFKVSNQDLRQGLKTVQFPGRIELVSGNPEMIFDGSHNAAGWRALARVLREDFSERPITFVLGILAGKSGLEAVHCFQGLSKCLALTEVPSPRSMKVEAWERLAPSFIDWDQVEIFSDPMQAFAWAKEVTPPEGLVVVAGSLYLVGQLRSKL